MTVPELQQAILGLSKAEYIQADSLAEGARLGKMGAGIRRGCKGWQAERLGG